MAFNRLERNEILEKFIISADYDAPNEFPHGAGSMVVLSKVWFTNDDGYSWPMPACIHRNQGPPNQIHAEKMFVNFIRRASRRAREINIEMIQNYSPCNDQANGEYCAREIVDYKNDMLRQGKEIEISITFANFYRTVYDGNDAHRAEENRNGLRLLHANRVQLRLLHEREEWKTFLKNDQFVRLNDNDREECLNRAISEERRAREMFNKRHYMSVLNLSYRDIFLSLGELWR